MRAVQVAELLARVAVVDNRQVDDVTVRTWQDLVGDLDFDDACAAVRAHRMTSTEYLQPAHVRATALRIGRERRAAVADRPAIGSGPASFQRSAEEQAAAEAAAARLREELGRLRAGRPMPQPDDRWASPPPVHTGPPPRPQAGPVLAERLEAERARQLQVLEAAGFVRRSGPPLVGRLRPTSGPVGAASSETSADGSTGAA